MQLSSWLVHNVARFPSQLPEFAAWPRCDKNCIIEVEVKSPEWDLPPHLAQRVTMDLEVSIHSLAWPVSRYFNVRVWSTEQCRHIQWDTGLFGCFDLISWLVVCSITHRLGSVPHHVENSVLLDRNHVKRITLICNGWCVGPILNSAGLQRIVCGAVSEDVRNFLACYLGNLDILYSSY